MQTTKKNQKLRLLGILTSLLMMFTCIAAAFPNLLTAHAVSTDYPAQLVRISTSDNTRNLNISGYSDNSVLNTWTTNGAQNENWRFDYVGTNSNGSYFKIVNQGTGRLITPLDYETTEGTSVVIYGSESAVSQHWYVVPVAQDSLGNDLYYKITNYNTPDLALTYNASANTISLSSYTGADNQKWLLNTAGLQGFAGYCTTPSGNVKASAIGGLLGQVVEVTTFDELKTACTSTEPMTIVVTKDIYGTDDTSNYEISTGYDGGQRYYCRDNYIYLQPNKTIVGSYSAHGLYNVYFRTYNESYGPAYNVIIRNFNVTHDTELNTDNLWEFAYGWNFWIDHCDLEGHTEIETSSLGSTDWDKFLNFKGTSDYVTISDCTFGYHEYGVLLGYPTDTLETYDTYNGQPCVTLCDNYYHDTVTRAPALMRYGYFHSFNNYVVNFDMGYTNYTASKCYSENNYFEAGTRKGSIINDTQSSSDMSSVYPAVFTDSGSINIPSSYGFTLTAKYAAACTWRPSTNYSYTAMTASDVKSYTMTNAGSKSSASTMTYAAFAEAGVPSAGYVTAPSEVEEPVQIEPLNGTLIQNLLVEESAGYQSWSIQTNTSAGDSVYGDRDAVTYTFLPKLLTGTERIVTACDAKAVSGDQAAFTAADDITVYIGLDKRVTSVPSWMSGYTDTGLIAQNSNDVVYKIYSCNFLAGDTVTLGTNGQSSGCVNYTVFVRKFVGDVNNDGAFNVTDVVVLQKWLLAVPNTQLANWKAADLCEDNTLNAFDLCLMKRLLITESELLSETMPEISETETSTSIYEPDGFQFSGKIYLVGDSTVCYYDENYSVPYNRYGWGMKIEEVFNNVTVQNLALAGRSSRSFLTETYYQTLVNNIGAGDYLFIQFGHNDEKTDETTYPGLGTYPGLDFSTLDSEGKNSSGQYSYEWILLNKYIQVAQSKGAVPILVTPITRRASDGQANYQMHVPYQEAMISLGEQYTIPVIDMTTLTTQLYTSLYNYGGAEETAKMHCYADTEQTTIDNTHLSNAGALKIASMIVEQTKELELSLGNNVN